MRRQMSLFAWLLAGSLVSGAGAALAQTTSGANPSPSTTPAPSTAAPSTPASPEKPGNVKHHHARGQVTAVRPDSMTVKTGRLRHREVTFNLSGQTMVREGKAQKSLNDVKVGDRVAVTYDQAKGAATRNADEIRILKHAQS